MTRPFIRAETPYSLPNWSLKGTERDLLASYGSKPPPPPALLEVVLLSTDHNFEETSSGTKLNEGALEDGKKIFHKMKLFVELIFRLVKAISEQEPLLLVNNRFLCSQRRNTFLCLSCPLHKDPPLLSKLEARLLAQRIPWDRNLCENGIGHAYTPKRILPTGGEKGPLHA
ncbi:hypothetical protein NPIL_410571 [Nephila pilipes]|uniref:Uncharacterized protein n=1 Tax=Nephila pilipes TaxID=299642 RepID=A0A8X6PU66_NEPPI|nr:hypothetical protein NPIL_410571 [Nephila pilipes]